MHFMLAGNSNLKITKSLGCMNDAIMALQEEKQNPAKKKN